MRIAIITHDTPHPFKGGSGHWITVYTEFLAQYHDVVIIRIKGRFPIAQNDVEQDVIIEERWKSLGVCFFDVLWSDMIDQTVAKSSLGQRVKGLFTFADCFRFPQLPSILRSERVDILIAVGPLCTMYAAHVQNVCKVSISAEGPHINRMVRYRNWLQEERRSVWSRLVSGIKNHIRSWQEERAEVKILKSYAKVLFAGQHYLRWAMKFGIKGATHIPMPLVQDDIILVKNSQPAITDTFKILMIGHLSQASNRTQLPMLLAEILPAMAQLFDDIPWVIRIVGNHDSVVGRYAALKQHPNFEFVGPGSHSAPEFVEANVLFVPVAAKTGPRTKILQAFACGLPVVAHINNQLGIAELVHYGNCILAETGFDLAVGLRKLYDDPQLAHRLALSGRKTYEANYMSDSCCEILHNLLKDSFIQFHRENGRNIEWWEK
jgi:glycosyltransferase involved in cell wall biosynthesis